MTITSNNSLRVSADRISDDKYESIYKLSDSNKKLYLSLIVKSRIQFLKYTENGEPYCATKLFEADVEDVLHLVGIDVDCTNPVVFESFKTIQRASIELDSPTSANGVIWTSFSLFSEISLTKTNGKYILRWAFPPSLFEMISNPLTFKSIYGRDVDSILN